MNISGTTETVDIVTNTLFKTEGGLNEVNLSTINITDENGLQVDDCFGITTKIISVDGENVTLTGSCDTSLEITISQGIVKPISCDYDSFDIQSDGVILFTFNDGTTNTNIHPECCEYIGYTPEIGPNNWWICVTERPVDPSDCNNYTPTGGFIKNWAVFNYAGGGLVTTVPNVSCCYINGFVDSIVNGEIKCIEEIVLEPCDGYDVVEPTPETGPITFTDPNNMETIIVPTLECCTALNYDYTANGGGFSCFKAPIPTVSFENTINCTLPFPTQPPACWEVTCLPTGSIEYEYMFYTNSDTCNKLTLTLTHSGTGGNSVVAFSTQHLISVKITDTTLNTTYTYSPLSGIPNRVDGELNVYEIPNLGSIRCINDNNANCGGSGGGQGEQ